MKPKLMNVDTAIDQILQAIRPNETETVSIMDALGRVLAEDLIGDTNLPPFANSGMDGYAIRASDSQGASQDKPVQLRVTQDIPAGTAPDKAIAAGEAARIMTGAPVPEGADAVIPVEDTDAQWTVGADDMPAEIRIFRAVTPQDNIRPVGENIAIGQKVLNAQTLIRSAEIGMLAALGCATVEVVRRPRVAILGSGDELLDLEEEMAPGKIRDVNSYMLASLVIENGGIPLRMAPARDKLDAVRQSFHEALALKPDLIISSAGVSVGATDLVRTVLDELGEVSFWRINLRPGKPLAYGMVQGVPFFGLPGNPVSAAVTFDVLVRPALLKMGRMKDNAQYIQATCAEDLKSDGRRSYVRVRLTRDGAAYIAELTGTQSSGALMSMVEADGLLIIPEDIYHVVSGTPLTVKLLRNVNQ